jgi:murein DD-endopeptidase MepM/ murein hydrolase activator NlpD
MAFPAPAFTKKREFRWFMALVLLAILLLLLQSGQKPAAKATPTPSPTPQATGYVQQMQDGTMVSRSYTFLDGGYVDSAVLQNNGNSTVDITSFYVVPKAFGADASKSDFVQNNSFNSRFISQYPIVHASDTQLAPGGQSRTGFSYNEPLSRIAIPFFFTAPKNGDEEKLKPLLEALSEYGLGEQTHALLSRTLSQILSSSFSPELKFNRALSLVSAFGELRFLGLDAPIAEKQMAALLAAEKPLDERLRNAFLYRDLLKREIAYADASGGTYASVLNALGPLINAGELESASNKLLEMEKEKGVKPEAALLNASGGNKTFDPYQFFPTHPLRVSVDVSEMDPKGFNFTILNSSVEVGQPLARFEGPAADYAGFGVVSLGKNLNISISADIGNAILNEDGTVDFSHAKASLITRFFALPEKYGNVTVEVNVKHESLKPLLDYYGLEWPEEPPTVDEALSAIGQAQQCNPFGASQGMTPQTFAGSAPGIVSCPLDGRPAFGGKWGDSRAYRGGTHNGIDVGVPKGTPIRAMANGVVASLPAGYCGQGITMDYGTITLPAETVARMNAIMAKTNYGKQLSAGETANARLTVTSCHSSKRFVTVGQQVKAGDVIGLVGSTGCPNNCGPHLHIQARLNGRFVPFEAFYEGCTQGKVTPSESGGSQADPETPLPQEPISLAYNANGCVQDYGTALNAIAPLPLGTLPANTGAALAPKSSACASLVPLVHAELAKTGLHARGLTTEYVMAMITQESSCRINPSNGQGPMQVVACAADRCSLTENIRRGVGQHIVPGYVMGRKNGLSGKKLLQFMGLYYNRGVGTAQKALKLYAAGTEFTAALNQACLQNFRASLCEKSGYGAYYYEAVQKRCVEQYGKACNTDVA